MSNNLPNFRPVQMEEAHAFIDSALSRGDESALVRLDVYDDDHFRAVFEPSFFTLADDRTEPSKSQWNTLKKRLKRMDKNVFVFKEHGETEDGNYYLDFGFFAETR